MNCNGCFCLNLFSEKKTPHKLIKSYILPLYIIINEMLELLLYWNHSKLNNHLQPPEGTRVSLVSWCTALTELSRRHQQSRPQRLALQPAGFPPICPVNLLIVLIKEKRKRRRSDTSVELWGSCLRGSLRLMGDHKGGYLSHVSQRGPHGTVVINVCVCTHGCFFFFNFFKRLPLPVSACLYLFKMSYD